MNKNNAIRIYFCYPRIANAKREEAIKDITSHIIWDNKVGFAGFTKRSYLQSYLSRRIAGSWSGEETLSGFSKRRVGKVIRQVTIKCFRKLELPSLRFFIFVFPWLGARFERMFKGINGFTPYKDTIHIFILPKRFSLQSLKDTVAHELNHAVFFRNHTPSNTLLEALIFEGLAENFREEVVRGIPTPWSRALDVQQSKKVLRSVKPSLQSKDYRLYKHLFFGGTKYQRWSGYSIGYWIVKLFRKTHPQLSWPEIMNIKPKEVFTLSPLTKKKRV